MPILTSDHKVHWTLLVLRKEVLPHRLDTTGWSLQGRGVDAVACEEGPVPRGLSRRDMEGEGASGKGIAEAS